MLSFIGEYEGPRPRINNEKQILKTNYIYLQKDDEILKLALYLNHMSIVDSLEDYINESDVYSFEILDEKNIKKKYNLKTSFFPYLGKFRMEGNLKKTENYFVPDLDDELLLLIDLYNNSSTSISFENFERMYNLNKNNILNNICSNLSIELIEKLDLNFLKKLLENTTNTMINIDLQKYKELKFIIESASDNANKFQELGLTSKLNETLGIDIKVKRFRHE